MIWLHNVPFTITNISNKKYIEIEDCDGIKSKHDLLALHKSGHLVLIDPSLARAKSTEEIEATPRELKRMHHIAYDLEKLSTTQWNQIKDEIEKIAGKYGVSTRQIYRWRELYAEFGLVGLKTKINKRGNNGKNILPEETEQVIQDGIKEYLLTRTPVSKDECIRLIRSKCSTLQIHAPSPGAVRSRINQMPEKSILKAQKGTEYANDAMRVSKDIHDVARAIALKLSLT